MNNSLNTTGPTEAVEAVSCFLEYARHAAPKRLQGICGFDVGLNRISAIVLYVPHQLKRLICTIFPVSLLHAVRLVGTPC